MSRYAGLDEEYQRLQREYSEVDSEWKRGIDKYFAFQMHEIHAGLEPIYHSLDRRWKNLMTAYKRL